MKSVASSALAVSLVLAALLSVPASVAAQKGCQDQECRFEKFCFACASAPGFWCSPQPGTCPTQCTTGRCDGSGDVAACIDQLREARLQLASSLVQPASGTRLLLLPQPDSPVRIVEVTYSLHQLVLTAVVRNIGDRQVSAVRLGRISVHASGSREIVSGQLMRFENSLLERADRRLTPQPELGATSDLHSRDATVIGTFVAEVVFADGGVWHANPNDLLGTPLPAARG